MQMPKMEPIPIPTKGKSIVEQMWALLTATRQYMIVENWYFYLPNGVYIVVPKGFIFDGASIPKPLWFFLGMIIFAIVLGVTVEPWILFIFSLVFVLGRTMLSPTGLLLVGGLVHDFAYRYGYLWRLDGDGEPYKYVYGTGDNLAYDDLFLKINLNVNGMVFTDHIATWLLMLFGKIAWTKNRDRCDPELKP